MNCHMFFFCCIEVLDHSIPSSLICVSERLSCLTLDNVGFIIVVTMLFLFFLVFFCFLSSISLLAWVRVCLQTLHDCMALLGLSLKTFLACIDLCGCSFGLGSFAKMILFCLSIPITVLISPMSSPSIVAFVDGKGKL